METWNKAVADQKDDEFGRLSFASALDTAPYYAIKVSPGIHHTMGGVKINTNAEVLTEAGEAIPGLYAAGEVTGACMARTAWAATPWPISWSLAALRLKTRRLTSRSNNLTAV